MKKWLLYSITTLILCGICLATDTKINIGAFQRDVPGATDYMNIGADQTDEPAEEEGPAAKMGTQVIVIQQ